MTMRIIEGLHRLTPEVAPEVTTDVTTEVKRLMNVMTGNHSCGELQEIIRLKNSEYFSDHGIKNEGEGIYGVIWKSTTLLSLVTVCWSLCR